MNRILLVGESNPYGADPDFALYPHPREASGNRLRLILGLTDNQYLGEHDRVNLCEGKWSAVQARAAMAQILLDRAKCGHRSGFVLCGAKVAAAFEQLYRPGTTTYSPGMEWAFLVIPHPSGRNRVWNDPEVAPRVRAAYLDLRKHLGMELP